MICIVMCIGCETLIEFGKKKEYITWNLKTGSDLSRNCKDISL